MNYHIFDPAIPKGRFLPAPRRREYTLLALPFCHRVYSPGELQFITTTTYRRTPLFLSDGFRHCFVQRLDEVRQELHFLLVGGVLMPEHFHVLIKPEPTETTPLIMTGLKLLPDCLRLSVIVSRVMYLTFL